MIHIDPDTLAITCPTGDTGMFLVKLYDLDGNPLQRPIEGVAIFAVAQRPSARSGYSNIVARPVEIVDNTATILLPNSLTRQITPSDDYYWDIRIVTDPEYDDDGNVIADDDSDEVHSLFAGRAGGLPKFDVPGVAKDV